MAELIVMGPFEGPGEEKTARELQAKLPNSWKVFAGRKLPGADRPDADLIVVGESQIFVLEEKSWGPKVQLDDVTWVTTHRDYINPLDRVAYLSRRLASLLKNQITEYSSNVGRRHLVYSGVILSHDSLVLQYQPGFDRKEIVLQLSGGFAVKSLRKIDDSSEKMDPKFRQVIIDRLRGLPNREQGELKIGSYTAEQELLPVGKMRRFQTHDDFDRELVLLCFPVAESRSMSRATGLASVEARALTQIEDLNRSWKLAHTFTDEVNGFFCTALIFPPGATHLESSIRSNAPARENGELDPGVARAVIRDAFDALEQVHSRGIIHRALCPQRIWLDRMNHVLFTDFVFPRIEGAQTVLIEIDEMDSDPSVPFRAPEIIDTLGDASFASDTYSLALSLAFWFLGRDNLTDSPGSIREILEKQGSLGGLLARCLADEPGERPTTGEVLRELEVVEQAPLTPQISQLDQELDWGEGTQTGDGGRYTLQKQLGRGGFATSWLAFDSTKQKGVVLKRFKDDDKPDKAREIYASAQKELKAAENLRHDRIALIMDISPSPTPTYLVYEYIEGSNMREFFASDNAPAITADACAFIATQLLESLEYLHKHGLRHGDVTPANVIISDTYEATMIDFGLTGQGHLPVDAITPEFASPELLATKVASPSSDVYGLAASMVSLMLGVPSVKGKNFESGGEYLVPQREEARWGVYGTSLIRCFMRVINGATVGHSVSARELIDEISQALHDVTEDGEWEINPTVDSMRRLIRSSALGNVDNRGLDSIFAKDTYVPTLLDEGLFNLLKSDYRVVILTGNPGDGKTSALEILRDRILKDSSAKMLKTSVGGWTIELGGRTITAVNDASESQGMLSSDDVLREAIGLTSNLASDDRLTLIAANDGRILQFFDDNSDYFPNAYADVAGQLKDQDEPIGQILLIDLKKRALAAPTNGPNLVAALIASMTRSELWATCESCNARMSCPIKANVDELRGSGARAVNELSLMSHLRRRRRFTLRDIRSTIARITTGDISCEEVAIATRNRLDLRKRHGTRVWDLAFDGGIGDPVIDDWTQVDPGLFPSPDIERAALERGAISSGISATTRDIVELQRKVYFGALGPGYDPASTQAYRFMEAYLGNTGQPLGVLKTMVLSGMSRLVGSPGFDRGGLAIAGSDRNSTNAVLKVVAEEEFELLRPPVQGRYVEVFDDSLELVHQSKTKMVLTLDLFELVMRANGGEIFNSTGASALLQDIEAFTAQLRSRPSHEVLIYNALGEPAFASKGQNEIILSVGGK